MKILLACATAALLGCGQAGNVPIEGGSTSSSAAAAQMPKHHYVVRDEMQYGYEGALSETARANGQVASPVLMFSYLGRKDGAYQVLMKEGDVRTVAECARPCEFAKIYTFNRDRFASKDVMRLNDGALLSYVFADAMNGHLEQMIGTQKGDRVTYWVDGAGRRLVIAAVGTSGVER